ncbi:MAG: prepilin-type N-terminal cleavage/methylation domain-containing protein [Candidatus Gastranaerophilales bacterium]|nr:prepilin-type N-terminal cleavage/methylation domain-containing protein [Candidatus Gastranaerophilales bacterium]
MKKKSGFTLAETLIVIAIIGIIASIVTPMLFGTTSDAELKAAWKKQYADLSQATQLIMVDNGGSLVRASQNSNSFRNLYESHFNYIKICNENKQEQDECWHAPGLFYYLNGTTVGSWQKNGYILNNGSLVTMWQDSSNCTQPVGTEVRCGGIYIDVNGYKKPNTIGKDIFGVHVLANGIKPLGIDSFGSWQSESNTCIQGATTTSNYGYGCAAKYLYE